MLQEPHGPTTESFAGVNYLRIRDPDKTDCHAPANHPTGGATTIQRSHALRPHRGTEADFTIENNPFAFTPGQLNKLLNPKSLSRFYAAGGLSGLEKGIRDRRAGLSLNHAKLDEYVPFKEAERPRRKTEPAVGRTSNRNRRLIDQDPCMDSFENRAVDANESQEGRARVKFGLNLLRMALACRVMIIMPWDWMYLDYTPHTFTVSQLEDPSSPCEANPTFVLRSSLDHSRVRILQFPSLYNTTRRAPVLVFLLALTLVWLLQPYLDIVIQPAIKATTTNLRRLWVETTAQPSPSYSRKRFLVPLLHGKTARPVLGPTTLEVEGTLNGTGVVAIADTGACFNFISEKLATTMGLQPLPGTSGQISLPNGRQVKSPGQVELTFQFAGETPTHTILCAILPKSTRELVLGGTFLKATQTMTRHRHRLRKVASCHIKPSLNLIGAGQDFLGGYLNGRECLAVPDTGSDIMVISMEFARSLCLKIHGKRRSRIQFLDGSQALTEGTVRAKWQFGSQETPMDHEFHVLKGLPVSAIISSGVLDEFDVFRRYAHRIRSAESISSKGWQDPSGMGIFGISLVKRCEEEIKSLSDSFLDDITSDNPFTPEKIERERARRDEIRDTIAKIPYEAVRTAKQDEEHLRKWRWDDLRKRHLEENSNTRSTLDPESRTGRTERLTLDYSNSSRATQQNHYGIKALRRLFR